MAFPTSATPARLAVIEALTEETGQPRALSASQLFRRATVSPSSARAIASKVNKRVAVVFSNPTTQPGANEFGSVILHDYAVRVVCSYAAGSELFNHESDVALAEIEADESPIRAALCAPEALRTSPSGAAYPYGVDTGLAGGALRSDGYRVQGPEFSPRVFTVTHFFTASIEILQPT